MIINHNLSAINSYRNQQRNSQTTTDSIAKLSSGMRINQAADDSSGLAISEKMRGQIRGLEKAKQNITDGISLIQVAEGAMGEMQSLLQRARELSVQSSNDTNTDEDRNAMQNELLQIIKEVDVISNNTEFNGIKLLAGNTAGGGSSGPSNSLADVVQSITSTGGINDTYTIDGIDYASAVIDFSNLNTVNDVKSLAGKGVHYTCPTCHIAYSIKFVDGNPDTTRLDSTNPVMEVDITQIENGSDLVSKVISTAYGQDDFEFIPDKNSSDSLPDNASLPSTATAFVTHFSKLGFDGTKLYIHDDRSLYAGTKFPTTGGHGRFEPTVHGETIEKDKVLRLNIQVGSNAGQSIILDIPNLTIKELAIENISILTRNDANAAITEIDDAISAISSARASVGTYQNRLEHTFNNVSNYELNISGAESRIRDLDMSGEITKLTNQQILLQASQAMSVQANQMTQGILQLLK
ncbi:flagellin [Sporosarcina sp. P18a]|uniref:flagellin n=1 Tax=Sporosarcina sp. P18a TaxID=2048259 RepID=UPI0013044326|nr:flagellin [Sporosarcina sp. P18a]